jgi:malonyl CoA-acyl carrier protein transacylase
VVQLDGKSGKRKKRKRGQSHSSLFGVASEKTRFQNGSFNKLEDKLAGNFDKVN